MNICYSLIPLLFPFFIHDGVAQKTKVNSHEATREYFGHALNIGAGLGYYRYADGVIPAFSGNFEFDVAENFTLAPFAAFYSYHNYYYWGNSTSNYKDYQYYRSVVPIGLKGFYYFDELLQAGHHWDFYAAGSIGLVWVHTDYEDGYGGNRSMYYGISPLYVDAHLGCEFHASKTLGVFLDLSTGISTIGITTHFK